MVLGLGLKKLNLEDMVEYLKQVLKEVEEMAEEEKAWDVGQLILYTMA